MKWTWSSRCNCFAKNIYVVKITSSDLSISGLVIFTIFSSSFEKDYNDWIKCKLSKSRFKWTGLIWLVCVNFDWFLLSHICHGTCMHTWLSCILGNFIVHQTGKNHKLFIRNALFSWKKIVYFIDFWWLWWLLVYWKNYLDSD